MSRDWFTRRDVERVQLLDRLLDEVERWRDQERQWPISDRQVSTNTCWILASEWDEWIHPIEISSAAALFS